MGIKLSQRFTSIAVSTILVLVLAVPPAAAQGPPGDCVTGAARAALARGAELLRHERYDEAIAALTAAIGADPSCAVAYTQRGRCHLKQRPRDKLQAFADFNRALELNPADVWAINGRGILYMLDERNKRASEDFSHAITLDRKFPLPYLNRGLVNLRLDRYAAAVADCSRAIELDPHSGKGYECRGRVAMEQDRPRDAVLDFTAALDREPGLLVSRFGRARALVELDRYQEALPDFDIVIRDRPNWDWPLNLRGLAYKNLGRLDRALADFNRAIEISNTYKPAYYNRGRLWLKKKQFERALHDFTRALELRPDDPWSAHNLAYSLSKLGRKSEARAAYERAARLYLEAGVKRAENGRYAAAISYYDDGLELDTRYRAPLLYNRGLAHEKSGNAEAAVADYTRAIETNPEFAQAWLRRGYAYAVRLNRPDAAKRDWKRAARLDRSGPVGRAAERNLARLRRQR